eukprot:m.369767 g.369767  ORF g.369767 m.369767 type:complete len:472 (+) comp20856_c0_seq2:494-1909(+)
MKSSTKCVFYFAAFCLAVLSLTGIYLWKYQYQLALSESQKSASLASTNVWPELEAAEVLRPNEGSLVQHWIGHGATSKENVAAANILGRSGSGARILYQKSKEELQGSRALLLDPLLSSAKEPYGIVVSSWRSRAWEDFCEPIRKMMRGTKRSNTPEASPVSLHFASAPKFGSFLSRLICAEIFALLFGRSVQVVDSFFNDSLVKTNEGILFSAPNIDVTQNRKQVHIESFEDFFLGEVQNFKKKELLSTVLLVDNLGYPSEILPLLNARIAKEYGSSLTLKSDFKTEDAVLCTSLSMLQPPHVTIHHIESSFEAFVEDITPMFMLGLAYSSFSTQNSSSIEAHLECAWQVSIEHHNRRGTSNSSVIWLLVSEDGIYVEHFFGFLHAFLDQKQRGIGLRQYLKVNIISGARNDSCAEENKWYGYFLLRETHACVDTNSRIGEMGCYASVRRHAFMQSVAPVQECLLYDNYY